MPQVNFVLEAETANAVQGILKVMDAQRQAAGETKKWKSENDLLTGSVQKLASVFAAGFSLNTILAATREWESRIERIAQHTAVLRKDMTAFAVMQDAGTRQAAMQQAGKLAVQYSVPLSQALDVVQSAQSMPGKNAQTGFKAAETLLKGSQLGMDPSSLAAFMNNLTRRGMADEWSVYLPLVTGKASYRTAEEVVKASEALEKWQDPVLAMAAAPEVISATSIGEFQTYLKRAGSALHDPNPKVMKAWKKLGINYDDPEMKKLEALQRAGIDRSDKLVKSGIVTDEREITGLASIVKNLDLIKPRNREFREGFKPGYLDEQIKSIRSEVPQIDLALKSESADAVREVGQTLSKEGIRAQIKEIASKQSATRILKDFPILSTVRIPWTDIGLLNQGGTGIGDMGLLLNAMQPGRGFDVFSGNEGRLSYLRELNKAGVADPLERQGLAYLAKGEIEARGGKSPVGVGDMPSFGQEKPGVLDKLLAVLEKIEANTATTGTTQRQAPPHNSSVQSE